MIALYSLQPKHDFILQIWCHKNAEKGSICPQLLLLM